MSKDDATRAAPGGRDIRTVVLPSEADELGVNRFTFAMLRKLAKKRSEGRRGWNLEPYTVQPDRGDTVERHGCEVEHLRKLLCGHVEKGDMVDIANFAMMIWNRENPNG